MKVSLVAPIEDILADPHYFPASIDFQRNRLTLIETNRTRLTNTPFLDGRMPFAEGIAFETSLSEAIQAPWPIPHSVDRFIFHVAFCGSTLLAGLLDVEGRSFAVREPHTFVEAANAWGVHSPTLTLPALQLLRDLLRRPWKSGETNICKPSNWANCLIPHLTAEPRSIRPLFVSTGQREYLKALVRGGRDRMVYVVRVTDHLLRHTPGGAQMWLQATQDVPDPMERVGRIGLVCLHVQLLLFEQAISKGRWEGCQLTLDFIERDPIAACMLASEALGLGLSEPDIERTVAARFGRYAKDPSVPYQSEHTATQNCKFENEYGRLFDRVQDWAALRGLKATIEPAWRGQLARRSRA